MGNVERWRNVGDRWPTRLAMVAELVPPGASVIDLGAGARALKDHLPPGCTYAPADLPDFDMDLDLWPDGQYDVAVMAGVLEYARHPGSVFQRLRRLASMVIVTYAHEWVRRDPEWNNLSEEEFVRLAEAAGFIATPAGTWHPDRARPQAIWLLS